MQNYPFSMIQKVPNIKEWEGNISFNLTDEQLNLLKGYFLQSHSVVDIKKLTCICEILKQSNKLYITGKIELQLIQKCVRTLKELNIDKNINIKREYLLEKDYDEHFCSQEMSWNEESDNLDVWNGRDIDIAELIIEELDLNIDKYPKSDNTDIKGVRQVDTYFLDEEKNQTKRTNNPFEVLKKLK